MLLLPDDGTENTKGKCQAFASHFPNNGAIHDEEWYIYPKFRLSCCSGSFFHKAHVTPSLPAGKDSLLYKIALGHPNLV